MTIPSLLRLSLRARFFLLFTLPIGVIAVFLYWYIPQVWRQHALHTITQKAELMTRMAALDLRSGLLFADYATVQDYVMELGNLEDVVYVVVVTNEALPVVSFNEHFAQMDRYYKAENRTFSADGKLLRTVAPIVHERDTLGRLYIGQSVSTLGKEMQHTRSTMAWISVLVFVVGAVVVLLNTTIAVRSLQKLGRTFDKIADGNYAERVSVTTSDEIGQLAAGLNRMAEKVQMTIERERELHQLKTQFIRTVSHEFRTPLTSIGLIADLLLAYSNRISKAETEEYLHKIKNAVIDLSDLINEFLLQSTASSMRDLFTPTDIEIESIVRSTVASMATLAAAHSIAVKLNVEGTVPHIVGDVRFFQHIVRNLLSNAIKYSLPHSEVLCSLTYDAQSVYLCVADHGIGIPAADLGQLFTPFFRASNSGKTQGTGLGLSIVKEFVEIHGGSIRVESTEGSGSTFTVALPIVAAAHTKIGNASCAVDPLSVKS